MNKIKRFFRPPLLTLLLSAVYCAFLSISAYADIAVIVHPQNPLPTLEASDVRRIYMGRMRMFPGSTQGIETIDHPETTARFASFYQALSGLTPAKLKRQRASYLFSGKGRLPIVLEDDAAVKAHVATTPTAIGYIQIDQVDDTVKVVATVKTQ